MIRFISGVLIVWVLVAAALSVFSYVNGTLTGFGLAIFTVYVLLSMYQCIYCLTRGE